MTYSLFEFMGEIQRGTAEAFAKDASGYREQPRPSTGERKPPTDRMADVFDFKTGKKLEPEEIAIREQEIADARAEVMKEFDTVGQEERIVDTALESDREDRQNTRELIDKFKQEGVGMDLSLRTKLVDDLYTYDLVDFTPEEYSSASEEKRLFGLRASVREQMDAEISHQLQALEELMREV